jgi:hypothetical protein
MSPDKRPNQSSADSSALDKLHSSGNSPSITCSVCGLVNRPGELQCSRCGALLATAGGTRKLDSNNDSATLSTWPTGEVIVTEQAPIILEIGDQWVTLPVADTLTVGRSSDVPSDVAADVDLSAYEAGDKGVSRQHIRLKRKNILVYVIDLGSTNGTFLNGRRLVPQAERLLRNGDELQLGRLKVKVRF